MPLKDYLYDGQRKLVLRDTPTDAGGEKGDKARLTALTRENLTRAALLQEMLYAEKREGLIIAIQARDAAGKDSLIKKVFGQLNPACTQVHSFKAPSKEELSHDYLWRVNAALPPRGMIGIFNRSQYEDVVAVRVHHLEQGYQIPARCLTPDFFERRFDQLRHWEEYLYENGYRMIKLFLHVSRDEQKARFIERIEREEKHWKLSTADMQERALWAEYDRAFEDAINATGTPHSPWYVLPADSKWYTRYLASCVLLEALSAINPQWPALDPAEAARIPAVMEQLRED